VSSRIVDLPPVAELVRDTWGGIGAALDSASNRWGTPQPELSKEA
jgi:hypothetical protein